MDVCVKMLKVLVYVRTESPWIAAWFTNEGKPYFTANQCIKKLLRA